jgi:ribonuclease Z
MPRLVILGSGYAVADTNHENTHMVLVGNERTVLIDCSGNPIVRLHRAGVSHDAVTDLIMTHFHPDHVSAVPLLLMDMWLLGRKRPLDLYGPEHTVERMENLMTAFGWKDWPNFFPLISHRLPIQEMTPVMSCDEFSIYASPGRHFIPTIGLRVEFHESGKILAFSCDTEPSPEIINLARGADVLIHEATGIATDPQQTFFGHSSAFQAGMIAQEAGVTTLYLIHYPTWGFNASSILPQAQQMFNGKVHLAEDLMEINF